MSANPCEDFRALLSSERFPETGEAALNWQRHIVECPACRDLLAAEERLDELLSSVPRADLPDDLAARVRSALEPMRRRQREDVALDRLLDLVPEPDVPHDLAPRVLQALRHQREPVRPAWRGYGIALAAAAALLFVLILTWSELGFTRDPRTELAQSEELITEDELVLYALENWELLMSDEVEVYLASLDPAELLVLELDTLAEVLDDDTPLDEQKTEEEQR